MADITLTHKIGADKIIPFKVRDHTREYPYPITGTVYFWIVDSKGAADAELEKSSPASGIVLDYAAGGLLTVTITDADAATLGEGTKWWGLWEEQAGGNRVNLAEGLYKVVLSTEDFS